MNRTETGSSWLLIAATFLTAGALALTAAKTVPPWPPAISPTRIHAAPPTPQEATP